MRQLQREKEGGKRKGRLLFYVFLFSLTFSLYSSLLAQDAPATLDTKVFEIAGELRCPVCTAESVGDSSEKEILAFFQERYGDWILLNPPKRGVHLLVWLLPLVAAIIGISFLAMYLRRWTKQARTTVEVSKEDLERVREEMKWQG
jgi:cytochrome c-type biogenesis protein CcmH